MRGFNPIKWNCGSADNCWNEKKRPRIEVFHDCFAGNINFGDVDGPSAQTAIVEINSRALMMEWKDGSLTIPKGQEIMYRNLSRTGFFMVVVVCGDPITMEVKQVTWYVDGWCSGWHESNLQKLKAQFEAWGNRVAALVPLDVRSAPANERARG